MTKWICNECKFSGQVCKCENTKYSPFFCVVHKVKQADWRIDNTDLNTATIESVEPETELPDWCKVGEWLYYNDNFIGDTYAKVKEVTDKYVMLAGCMGDVQLALEDVQYADQARLRPYNADEMKALVGKVLEHDGNASLVIVYLENGLLRVGTKWVSAERLIEDGYTIDGKPCGKLEHLEDGEWVE